MLQVQSDYKQQVTQKLTHWSVIRLLTAVYMRFRKCSNKFSKAWKFAKRFQMMTHLPNSNQKRRKGS